MDKLDIINRGLSRPNINKDILNSYNGALKALIINDICSGYIIKYLDNNTYYYSNIIDNKPIDNNLTSYKIVSSDSIVIDNNYYIYLLNIVKKSFIKYGTKFYKLRDENNKEYESKVPGIFGGNKRLKIYGRLNCKSANMWIDKGFYIKDRVFFKDELTAIKAGYRPCSNCMKKEYKIWKKGADI